eukprot:TRINITY_DN5622_c1_g2_i1.p2 TRINITY_DN5622_c1_g2~~TRINITY_DN5622_c1_g2_i1.p2  ORF type:complete len:101 (-),score=13.37 TRINITY_DN5622_c1_g2_i1:26-328(-)
MWTEFFRKLFTTSAGRRLKRVCVKHHSGVTTELVQALTSNSPELRVLDLEGTPTDASAILKKLATKCPLLQVLILGRTEKHRKLEERRTDLVATNNCNVY